MPVPDMPKRVIQCLSQICPKGPFSACLRYAQNHKRATQCLSQICPKGLLSACPRYAQKGYSVPVP
ncbi:MAG: hypothetical protein HFJ36_01970, partial [Clostridia bacterium]|nr:hypothetical protein [Clostridia bacterium]